MSILVPWRKSVIEADPDLDDDDMVIVYLDCYPVHAGDGFRFYVSDTHPYIILCFVPANCNFLHASAYANPN